MITCSLCDDNWPCRDHPEQSGIASTDKRILRVLFGRGGIVGVYYSDGTADYVSYDAHVHTNVRSCDAETNPIFTYEDQSPRPLEKPSVLYRTQGKR